MSERTPMEALRSALRFAASRSCITSAEELAIMDAWNNTRPQPAEAPASEWAYELAGRIVLGNQSVGNAASIIEHFAEREAAADAAGYRRGVEDAAKVAAQTIFDARTGEIDTDLRCVGHHLETRILTLIETQEKG